jgi:hypothetical protein
VYGYGNSRYTARVLRLEKTQSKWLLSLVKRSRLSTRFEARYTAERFRITCKGCHLAVAELVGGKGVLTDGGHGCSGGNRLT